MILLHLLISILFANQVEHRLIDIPFYFGAPEHSKLALDTIDFDKEDVVINNPVEGALGEKGIGLRLFVFPDLYHNKKTDVRSLLGEEKINEREIKEKQERRAQAIRRLTKLGVLKNGDIALTFRPYWQKTLPYAHGQMGISHSSVIYIKNDRAYNLDMPLNYYYVGNLDSEFNSTNFLDVDYLHIIRPRNFSNKEENFTKWVDFILKDNPYFRYRNTGALSFNSDYQAPKYSTYETTGQDGANFIVNVAKILKGESHSENPFALYCSEFIYAIHSLSSCRPEELPANSDCLTLPFGGAPMAPFDPEVGSYGLGEGPLAILDSLDLTQEEIIDLLKNQFFRDYTKEDVSKVNYVKQIFSSGHEDVSSDPTIQLGAAVAAYYYFARLMGLEQFEAALPIEKNGSKKQIYTTKRFAQEANKVIAPNYSPTSFLINSFNLEESGKRDYDYVGTISFVDEKKYDEAREVSGLDVRRDKN